MEVLTIIAIAISISAYIFLPPLTDGIERKIKADVQCRYGPRTVFQTWYDILKLMSKEIILPSKSIYIPIVLSLLLTLTLVLAAFLSYIAISMNVNVIYITLTLAIIMSIHVLSLVIYIFTSNPFSIIGTFRIITMDILNEIGLITFSTLLFITKVRNFSNNVIFIVISFIPLLISIYALCRRLPYDLHEAEPELASGSVIELSGSILGIYIYNHLLERYILTSIPILLVLWIIEISFNMFVIVLLLHLFTASLYLVFAMISVILGRSRVNLAVKTFTFLYFLFIVVWIGAHILEHIIY